MDKYDNFFELNNLSYSNNNEILFNIVNELKDITNELNDESKSNKKYNFENKQYCQ